MQCLRPESTGARFMGYYYKTIVTHHCPSCKRKYEGHGRYGTAYHCACGCLISAQSCDAVREGELSGNAILLSATCGLIIGNIYSLLCVPSQGLIDFLLQSGSPGWGSTGNIFLCVFGLPWLFLWPIYRLLKKQLHNCVSILHYPLWVSLFFFSLDILLIFHLLFWLASTHKV
jgi:hypothetical protein